MIQLTGKVAAKHSILRKSTVWFHISIPGQLSVSDWPKKALFNKLIAFFYTFSSIFSMLNYDGVSSATMATDTKLNIKNVAHKRAT